MTSKSGLIAAQFHTDRVAPRMKSHLISATNCIDLTMDDGSESESNESGLPVQGSLVARKPAAGAAASAGLGAQEEEPLHPDPPPDAPVPAIPEEILVVMFGFPRWRCDRYEPTQVSLAGIVCTPCVRIVETPHGRHAVAAADIPAHTTLGWYEGLLVRNPSGLTNLHPYAMSKCGDKKGTPAIIGSPLAWPSYVDHGSGAYRNIAICCGERPSSPPTRNREWPFMYSTRSIRAGEKLHFNYDGDGDDGRFLRESAVQRRDVYGFFCSLIRQQPPLSVYEVFTALSKKFPNLGNFLPAQQREWDPLFLVLRPNELEDSPRDPRAGGVVDRPQDSPSCGKSRRRNAGPANEEAVCAASVGGESSGSDRDGEPQLFGTPGAMKRPRLTGLASRASGCSGAVGASQAACLSAPSKPVQAADIAIDDCTQGCLIPQQVATQGVSEDGAAAASVSCAALQGSATGDLVPCMELDALQRVKWNPPEDMLCVSATSISVSSLETARRTPQLVAGASEAEEDVAKKLAGDADTQQAAYAAATAAAQRRSDAHNAVKRALEQLQVARGLQSAAQAEVDEANCEGSRMLDAACEGPRLEMRVLQALEAARASELLAAATTDPGAVESAVTAAAAAQAASEAYTLWAGQREAREAGAVALAARRVELMARLNRLSTESSAAQLSLQDAKDTEARLPPIVDVERARQASLEAQAAVERHRAEVLRRERDRALAAAEMRGGAEAAALCRIQEPRAKGGVFCAAEQGSAVGMATAAELRPDLSHRVFEALGSSGSMGVSPMAALPCDSSDNAQPHQGVCGAHADPAQAVAQHRRAAEAGHADAQFNLALCLEHGNGLDSDPVQAAEWYLRAAEAGHRRAQYYLALRFTHGNGVPADAAKAVSWCRRAAEAGLADAQFDLAQRLECGKGVPADAEQAAAWYLRAAELGHVEAQHSLALCFEKGNGVPADPVKATAWYLRAAEAGDVDAQYTLAQCYERGKGVPADAERAITWYRNAAEAGHLAAAQKCVAGVLLNVRS